MYNIFIISEPFFAGGQPNDDRIIVEENIIEAPDYTDGERKWKESTIIIDGVKRTDDGLYECQAENEGGRFYKSGHITVQFGPTFEDQLTSKEWSWDQRPIKLSCIGKIHCNHTLSLDQYSSNRYSKCHSFLVVQWQRAWKARS